MTNEQVMTSEQAVKLIEQLKNGTVSENNEQINVALDMAINSFNAWDKVRIEIVNLETWGFADRDTNPKPLVIRSKVLQIITKHLKGVAK